jgi:MraZ protein
VLIGSYLANFGDKRRVAVPKKFLTELGDKPIIAKWYEDCLILVSAKWWENILSRLTGQKKIANLGTRDIERFILGSAYETEPDSQGRIVIPEVLSQFASLGKEIIFLGLGDRVEIWNKEIWEEKSNQLAKVTKDYIESIAKNE